MEPGVIAFFVVIGVIMLPVIITIWEDHYYLDELSPPTDPPKPKPPKPPKEEKIKPSKLPEARVVSGLADRERRAGRPEV